MQIVKPLSHYDNGALIEVVRDIVQTAHDDAGPGSTDERRAYTGLQALMILESRQSFQSIKSMKE